MKIFMRIEWQEYYLDATPGEVAVLNKLLSQARRVIDQQNDCETLTVNPDAKLPVAMRILKDDCTVTIDNPATPKEQ